MSTNSNSQTPANAVATRALPTFTGYITTKFDVTQGFDELEIIKNETGRKSNFIGSDSTIEAQWEAVVLQGTSIASQLSYLTDNSSLQWLVQTKPQVTGEGGKATRVKATLSYGDLYGGAAA